MRAYADLIGEELGLDADSRSKLHWAALLHDVGKLDVPSVILNKTERLTPAEWNIVRRHPAAAELWLEPVKEWLGDWALAASQHHERFDGDGYPNGLRGEEISLAGRIVAVADAFDVMTAARSYKKPYPAAQARAELAKNAGTQFDPRVVRALLAVSLDKLRLVMGPLAWLSGLSGLFSLGGVASGAAAAVSATVVAASAFAAPVAAPARHRTAVELVAEGAGPTSVPSGAVVAGARGGTPPTSRVDPARVAADPPRTPTRTHDVAGAPTVGTVAAATPTTAGPGSVPQTSPDPGPNGGSAPDPEVGPTTTAPATEPTTTPSAGPRAPVAADDSRSSGAKDVMLNVLANDVDPDGNLDPSSLTITAFPAGGYRSLKVTDGRIRVQVEKHLSATIVFTYRVCDTTHLCSEATASVTFTNAK